ncbi:MAG: site-specific DNA-methyltransferase [Acidobacteriota bacterium]
MKPDLVTPRGVLFKSDCLELLAHVKEDSVDTVFADPPFNLGKEYNNGGNDRKDNGDYLDWCEQWLSESARVLKPGGSLFVYILPRWGFRFASYLEDIGMEFRHWIAVSMKGAYPRGRRLYPAHYCLLYFSKGEAKTFNRVRLPIPVCRHCGGEIKDYGGHRNKLNPAGLNLTDFWDDTSPARHRKDKSRWHINELKPTIPERCILVSTNEGDVVFDPFGGGGSTYVSAERLKRYWIGTEIGPSEPIIDRFRREFPDLPNALEIPWQLRTILSAEHEDRSACRRSPRSFSMTEPKRKSKGWG